MYCKVIHKPRRIYLRTFAPDIAPLAVHLTSEWIGRTGFSWRQTNNRIQFMYPDHICCCWWWLHPSSSSMHVFVSPFLRSFHFIFTPKRTIHSICHMCAWFYRDDVKRHGVWGFTTHATHQMNENFLLNDGIFGLPCMSDWPDGIQCECKLLCIFYGWPGFGYECHTWVPYSNYFRFDKLTNRSSFGMTFLSSLSFFYLFLFARRVREQSGKIKQIGKSFILARI